MHFSFQADITMDPEVTQKSCRHCKKYFPIKSFALHAEYNTKCKHIYTPQEISDLKAQSKELSAAKKKLKVAIII